MMNMKTIILIAVALFGTMFAQIENEDIKATFTKAEFKVDNYGPGKSTLKAMVWFQFDSIVNDTTLLVHGGYFIKGKGVKHGQTVEGQYHIPLDHYDSFNDKFESFALITLIYSMIGDTKEEIGDAKTKLDDYTIRVGGYNYKLLDYYSLKRKDLVKKGSV